MSTCSNVVFLLLLSLFHSSQVCFCTNSTTRCRERERQALLKFRSSFTSTSNEGPLGSWEGLDCCHWNGVGCDAISAHVVRLDLRPPCNTYVSGYCNSYNYTLEAEAMDPSLLELEHLNYLDLSNSFFNYSHIPMFLFSMKQLRYLNLSNSCFIGMIPHHLANLSNLHALDLSMGLLYADDMGWVSKLSSLRHIAMNSVSLEEAHNLFQVLYMLPSLSKVEFRSCGILITNNNVVTHAPINSTLFLPKVELLDLSHNHLYGSILDAFQNMTSIRDLYLSYNSISLVPYWLGNIYSLVHLDLSWNPINVYEVSIMSLLNSTCSLQSLDLSYNLDFSSNHFLPNVSSLSFGNGNLSECSAHDLEELLLSSCGVNGSLPSSLGQLKNLKRLDLSYNFLYGPVPVTLGGSNLVELDLSHNLLEGIVSVIHFERLSNIQNFQIGFNKIFLKLDSNWTPPFHLLTDLGMASCSIGTEFPQWLQKQGRLSSLDLSNNSIRGIIPKTIGHQNPKLISLDLEHNLIEGSIPSSLCKLEMLLNLGLSYNRLSGEIPNCWNSISKIQSINLSFNNLSGIIPSTFWNLSQMQWLTLSNNNLHGDLHDLFKDILGFIQVLDLSGNQFTGMIPSWIGEGGWPWLQILRLSQNFLNGDIPSSLCKLPRLRILDLSGCNLAGSIPSCICNLSGINAFHLTTVQLIDEGMGQVLKGMQEEYTSNLVYLTNIDLSNNNLNGSIPKGLTCLSGLIGLNLSHNNLLGMIPSKIANMVSLESIDFSSNQLFGPIPTNMAALTSLSFLNLSNNNFSGSIPKGAQFSTFSPSSFGGNPYICGDLLNKSCPRIGISQPPTDLGFHNDEDDNRGKEKVLFYFVISLGFITGFWGVIGFLFLNKKWRYACFQHVDNFVDFMYVEIHIRIARVKNKSKN